jgi:tetratricopeptide (TPR) repeat protein
MSRGRACSKVLILAVLGLGARLADAEDCGPTPYDCAVLQASRQDWSGAIASLERMLEGSPRDLRALNLLGIALTGAGRGDEANRRFQEALAISPVFVPARKNLAVNQFTAGRHAEAEREFQEVLKLAPTDEIAHVHLAEIRFQRNELASALGHYEKARARLGEKPAWTLHYARCLVEKKRSKDAVSALDRLPGADADVQFEAGVLLGQAGQPITAAAFFGRARKGYRDPYVAGYNQVLMLVRGGDAPGAIRVGEELLAEGRKPAELYNLLSEAYVAAGRIKEAYEALRTATRLEPQAEGHYLDLATICIEHENYDLGLEIVDVGLHYRPDSFRLRLERGVLLAMKSQLAQAEKEFEAARALVPDSAAPYVALAMTWMQTGQTEKAVEVLRQRNEASPKEAVIPYILAIALLRSGADPAGSSGTEALEALQAAVRRDPRFGAAHAELGKLLLKRGEVDAAVTHLEKALAVDPRDAAPAYALAQAYFRKGDKARAEELMAKVSKRNDQEREGGSDDELRRIVVRIVKEGAAPESESRPLRP